MIKKSIITLGILLLSMSGCRNYTYLFMDMAYAPSLDAQQYDNMGKRIGNFLPPAGAVPYKAEYLYIIDERAPESGILVDQGKMFCKDLKTCSHPGALGNEAAGVLVSPYKVDKDLLDKGKEQYEIYCVPCHGSTGKADGPVTIGLKPGGMRVYANVLPIARVNKTTAVRNETWPEGRIYAAVSTGINTMGSYISQIPEKRNRWAIAHYVKKLQEDSKK